MQRYSTTLAILLLSVSATFSSSLRADDRGLDNAEEKVEVDPVKSAEYNGQGLQRINDGEYGEALSDFSKAVRLDPDSSEPRNNRAFLRATCPEARYRDGAKAVADATRACELGQWKDWVAVDTLAAAYTEKGDFDEAKKWQSKAINLTKSVGAKQRMKARLELYAAGKPYRQAATK